MRPRQVGRKHRVGQSLDFYVVGVAMPLGVFGGICTRIVPLVIAANDGEVVNLNRVTVSSKLTSIASAPTGALSCG